jgi:hypothetical protein
VETVIPISITDAMDVEVLGRAKMMGWDRMVSRVVKMGKEIQTVMGHQVDKTATQTIDIPANINSSSSSSSSSSGAEDQTTKSDHSHRRGLARCSGAGWERIKRKLEYKV